MPQLQAEPLWVLYIDRAYAALGLSIAQHQCQGCHMRFTTQVSQAEQREGAAEQQEKVTAEV